MVSSYRVEGRFIESCDCFELCPCWVDETPDEGHCTGLVAWDIRAGEIDGVDVAGRVVVAVTGHGSGRRSRRSMTVLFVDDGADDAAFDKLGAAFAGRQTEAAGGNASAVPGPLGELSEVTGTVVAPPQREKITIARTGNSWRVRVGEDDASATVVADGRELSFDTSGPLSLDHTALHAELQIQGEAVAQRSERLSLAVPALPGGYVEVTARSGMSGAFAYVHDPGGTG
jgi:Protein of unknown function (DUF1326)